MLHGKLYHLIKSAIALLWLINGLYCKVLNQVPRHEEIVEAILPSEHSETLNLLIGLSEIGMAVWIISNIKVRLNVWVQVIIIALMNVLEILLVPDLLLWGKLNGLFALLLIVVILLNEYKFKLQAKTSML